MEMANKPGSSRHRSLSGRRAHVPRARWSRIAASFALTLALLLPLALAAVAIPAAAAYYSGSSELYDDAARAPRAPVAIVLGAGLTSAGQPSPMLAHRVDAAVDLYVQGRVDRILMTGDNSTVGYDEVTAMKERAVALGVPAAQVNLDYAGFRTYDSAYRARAVFGIERAIFVTQRYHLPRALFLARSFGIESTGFVAGLEQYPGQEYYNLRELVALAVSWYEINVTRPQPRYLGEPVDLESQNS